MLGGPPPPPPPPPPALALAPAGGARAVAAEDSDWTHVLSVLAAASSSAPAPALSPLEAAAAAAAEAAEDRWQGQEVLDGSSWDTLGAGDPQHLATFSSSGQGAASSSLKEEEDRWQEVLDLLSVVAPPSNGPAFDQGPLGAAAPWQGGQKINDLFSSFGMPAGAAPWAGGTTGAPAQEVVHSFEFRERVLEETLARLLKEKRPEYQAAVPPPPPQPPPPPPPPPCGWGGGMCTSGGACSSTAPPAAAAPAAGWRVPVPPRRPPGGGGAWRQPIVLHTGSAAAAGGFAAPGLVGMGSAGTEPEAWDDPDVPDWKRRAVASRGPLAVAPRCASGVAAPGRAVPPVLATLLSPRAATSPKVTRVQGAEGVVAGPVGLVGMQKVIGFAEQEAPLDKFIRVFRLDQLAATCLKKLEDDEAAYVIVSCQHRLARAPNPSAVVMIAIKHVAGKVGRRYWGSRSDDELQALFAAAGLGGAERSDDKKGSKDLQIFMGSPVTKDGGGDLAGEEEVQEEEEEEEEGEEEEEEEEKVVDPEVEHEAGDEEAEPAAASDPYTELAEVIDLDDDDGCADGTAGGGGDAAAEQCVKEEGEASPAPKRRRVDAAAAGAEEDPDSGRAVEAKKEQEDMVKAAAAEGDVQDEEEDGDDDDVVFFVDAAGAV